MVPPSRESPCSTPTNLVVIAQQSLICSDRRTIAAECGSGRCISSIAECGFFSPAFKLIILNFISCAFGIFLPAVHLQPCTCPTVYCNLIWFRPFRLGILAMYLRWRYLPCTYDEWYSCCSEILDERRTEQHLDATTVDIDDGPLRKYHSTPTNPVLLTQQSNILSYCRTITVECSSMIGMFERFTCDETHTDLVELAHRSGTAIYRKNTALHHRSRVRFCFSVAFRSFCPTGQAIHHQFRRPAYHRSPVAYRLPRLR